MPINATNIRASQALRGEGVQITLSAAESLSVLPTLTVGDKCTISSSSKIGYINRIDTYGKSFLVEPESPAKRFDSTTNGILAVNELITVDI